MVAGGDITVSGSKLNAGGDASLRAGGDVAIAAVVDEYYYHGWSKKSRSKLDITQETTRNQGAELVAAGGDVTVVGHDNVAVQASRVAASGDVTLKAETGAVALLSGTDTSFVHEKSSRESMVWQSTRDRGESGTSVKMTELEAGDKLTITAAKGVTADYRASGDLKSSLAELAKNPATAWTAQVALRDDVTWRAVQEAHQSWDYKTQGLSGPAAAVIAIAVAVATSGAGLGAGLFGGQAVLGATGAAMVDAGMSALISQAAVSVINNRGDIGKVLKELGSAQTVKNLAIAMATAGLTQGIADAAGVSNGAKPTTTLADGTVVPTDFIDRLAYQGIKTASGVAANTAIGGAGLGDALKSGGLSLATTMATQVLAKGIGDIAADLKIEDGDLRKIIAHALAGCAAGQITKNCVAGAIGAGVQEAAGGLLKDISKDDAQKIQLAGLSAAVATMLVGGDASAVNTANAIAQDAATYNRQLHVKELQAIRDKAKALADTNGDGVLDAAETAKASDWEGRLTSEALRTVDAYWNNKLAADGEAARVLQELAASSTGFDVTEGGRAVAFLQRQNDFYLNRVLYAAYIRENASQYDKALANWTPDSRQALQGKVKPSSLALIESVATGAMGNATGDYVKRDADGKPLQGTIFDTLADVKAAQRELIAAERQLKDELAKPGLSDGVRQETENQLQQVRTELRVATTASDLVLTNYDRMVIDGKLRGYGTAANDTVVGLLELAADLGMAKYLHSSEAQKNLENRAVALLEAVVGSKEIIDNLQRTYERADALEQKGQIEAAAALRAETSLLLASTLSGVGAVAKGAAVGIEKLAGTTGKLVAKAEALVAKGAGKAADLFDPKSGQVSGGHGAASAAADADAGVPPPSNTNKKLPSSLPENLAGYANPKDIRFTQDSVSNKFSDGRSLQSTIDELKSGKISSDDLPPIRVFEKDGAVYTLDNRRLLAASEAGVPIKITPATTEEIAKSGWKMTTPNGGTIICIRGVCN